MNSKSKGNISEAKVLARLLQLGEDVLLPFGDNLRYDLAICRGNIIERVQVKTANHKDTYLEISTASSQYHRGGKSKTYNGEVEFFMVYCIELDKVYKISINEVEDKKEIRLRLDVPKNGQTKNIRYASDYEY